MRPNPLVHRLQGANTLEEIIRRDSIVQHAAKILHPFPKDTSDVQLHR